MSREHWRVMMKTLGFIGGMSWESTAIYYRHLNEIARKRLGGLHSAKLLLWSFDFADVADLQQAGDWEGATALMIDAASGGRRGRGARHLHEHHAPYGVSAGDSGRPAADPHR